MHQGRTSMSTLRSKCIPRPPAFAESCPLLQNRTRSAVSACSAPYVQATEIYDEVTAAHYKRFGRGTRGRRHPSRREMKRSVEPPRVSMPTGDSVDLLGMTHILEKRRLPMESRDSTGVPGLNAARRQAAAPCVRVGSRVSFNTVVAAILIPSARDLQAAVRRELW